MIANGSKVTLHYTLTVEGQVVDSSKGREPLNYVHGSGQIIPGLEQHLIGLKKGDKKSVVIPPEGGYGPHHPQGVQKVPRTAFKDSSTLKPGDIVSAQMSGKEFQATVTLLSETEVTLDLNHPLAGKTLSFDVEVVSVE